MRKLKILFFLLLGVLPLGLNGQDPSVEVDSSTTLEMDKMEYVFDTIQEGDTVKAIFKVKNIGAHDLFIRQIWPSCGCSVVEFKKSAIKTGEEIKVLVIFDSFHKTGEIENSFQMFSNAGFHTFYLRGVVQSHK